MQWNGYVQLSINVLMESILLWKALAAATGPRPVPARRRAPSLLHITRGSIKLEHERFSEVAIMPLSIKIDRDWGATATLAGTANESSRPGADIGLRSIHPS